MLSKNSATLDINWIILLIGEITKEKEATMIIKLKRKIKMSICKAIFF